MTVNRITNYTLLIIGVGSGTVALFMLSLILAYNVRNIPITAHTKIAAAIVKHICLKKMLFSSGLSIYWKAFCFANRDCISSEIYAKGVKWYHLAVPFLLLLLSVKWL